MITEIIYQCGHEAIVPRFADKTKLDAAGVCSSCYNKSHAASHREIAHGR